MVSPLPKNKRAKHPDEAAGGERPAPTPGSNDKPGATPPPAGSSPSEQAQFTNNPFSQLESAGS